MNTATFLRPPLNPAVIPFPVLDQDPWTRRILDQERAQAELETGTRIRSSLLESSRTGETDSLTWASWSRGSRVVGGDFHDVTARPSGGVDVVVGGLADKGLPAALMGAACLNGVLRAMAALGPDGGPYEILTSATLAFTGRWKRPTPPDLAFARIDGDPMTLSMAQSGHVQIAVRSPDGSVFEPRPRAGQGEASPAPTREIAMSLAAGDLVLISTDELTRFARRGSRIFNVARWLGEIDAATPAEVVAALGADVDSWGGDDAPDADITVVAIAVKPHILF